MQDMIETFALRWERLERFDFVTEVERFVASMEARLLLGRTSGDPLFREKLNELIAGIPRLRDWPRAMVARKWLLDRIDEAVIEQQRRPQPCVLAHLLAARDKGGRGFTPENLRHEMLHLFIASYAPTRIGCLMQLFALGTHPDMMERARREANEVTPKGSLSLDTLKKLTYIRQFSYESRRKFPVFAHPGFRLVTQTCKYAGYAIPAGWHSLAGFEATMMNHQAFLNPDNFVPERFTVDPSVPAGEVITNPGGLVPGSYCPHGVGQHRCTGEPFVDMLLSALTALLLRSHSWYFPSSTFVYTSELFAIPKGGLLGRFHRVAHFDKDIR
jgi:cytochrome P450